MSNRKHLIIVHTASEEASKMYFQINEGSFLNESGPEKTCTLNIPVLGLDQVSTNFVLYGENFEEYPTSAVLFVSHEEMIELAQKVKNLDGLSLEVGRHCLEDEEIELLVNENGLYKVSFFGDFIQD